MQLEKTIWAGQVKRVARRFNRMGQRSKFEISIPLMTITTKECDITTKLSESGAISELQAESFKLHLDLVFETVHRLEMEELN